MGRHSKSYKLNIEDKSEEGRLRIVRYIVGIDRKGKKKGYDVVDNIIKQAYKEVTKSIKSYVKLYPDDVYNFTIAFVIKNASGIKLPEDESKINADLVRKNHFEIPSNLCNTTIVKGTYPTLKFILVNCEGTSITSNYTSDATDSVIIDIVNSEFININITHNDYCKLKLSIGSKIRDIIINQSDVDVYITAGSELNYIITDCCENVTVCLPDGPLPNPSIFFSCTEGCIYGSTDNMSSIKDLHLDKSNVYTFGKICVEKILTEKSSVMTRDKINYTDSYLKYENLKAFDINTIEGELIAYKLLINTKISSFIEDAEVFKRNDIFRIAKVRIPADAKRIMPYDKVPIIRAEKVEVLEIYTVDGIDRVNGTTDDPAYNFMYLKNIVEYCKGKTIESTDFSENPFDTNSRIDSGNGGILCYNTLDATLSKMRDLYISMCSKD